MNGQEYVKSAVALVEKSVSEIKASKLLDGDHLLEGTEKAGEVLAGFKKKATLRTKAGTNLVFPVFDAAEKLEEAWEEAQESDDLDELKEQMEAFVGSVEALGAALKERTVIMT